MKSCWIPELNVLRPAQGHVNHRGSLENSSCLPARHRAPQRKDQHPHCHDGEGASSRSNAIGLSCASLVPTGNATQHLLTRPGVRQASSRVVGFRGYRTFKENFLFWGAPATLPQGVLLCGRSLLLRCCWPAGLHPSVRSMVATSRSAGTVATLGTTVASSSTTNSVPVAGSASSSATISASRETATCRSRSRDSGAWGG